MTKTICCFFYPAIVFIIILIINVQSEISKLITFVSLQFLRSVKSAQINSMQLFTLMTTHVSYNEG